MYALWLLSIVLPTVEATTTVASYKLVDFDRAQQPYEIEIKVLPDRGYTLSVRLKVPFRKGFAYYDRRWITFGTLGSQWDMEHAVLNTVNRRFVAAVGRNGPYRTLMWLQGNKVVSVSNVLGNGFQSVSQIYPGGPIYLGADSIYKLEGGPKFNQKYLMYCDINAMWWEQEYYHVERFPEEGKYVYSVRGRPALSRPVGSVNGVPVYEGFNQDVVYPGFGTYRAASDSSLYSRSVPDDELCGRAVQAATIEYALLRRWFEKLDGAR